MRVVLRADADDKRGTGHVMRCLTLAESLLASGHDVRLLGSIESVPWLERRVEGAGLDVVACAPDSLDTAVVRSTAPDWLVIDSYSISAAQISEVNEGLRCLAIIDGDDRGIDASLYLDQNLGAETKRWREPVLSRLLGGSSYCLIRDAVLHYSRVHRTEVTHTPPHVVAFMGGSDPLGLMLEAVDCLIRADLGIRLTAVCGPSTWAPVTERAKSHSWIDVIGPTDSLPELLGSADAVVSASGTSVWELCTLAVPSVVVAVVDNQRMAVTSVNETGVAIGVDATRGSPHVWDDVGAAVGRVLADETLRRSLIDRCRKNFDGKGKRRVVRAMERGLL